MIPWERRVILKHYLDQGGPITALTTQFRISRRTIHYWISSGQLDVPILDGAGRGGASSHRPPAGAAAPGLVYALPPGAVPPDRSALDVLFREEDGLHLVGGEHSGLVVVVRRAQAAALAVSQHAVGAHRGGELYGENPAVPTDDGARSVRLLAEVEDAEAPLDETFARVRTAPVHSCRFRALIIFRNCSPARNSSCPAARWT